MDKRALLKDKIDKIAKESFNNEQKEIAKKIIDNTAEEDLDAVWSLISQRIKTGFVFDSAPEINHNCISYIKENKKLGINLDKSDALEHSFIIGENYDALKNLLATYTDKQGRGLINVIYIDPPYNTDKSKAEGNDYKEEIEGKSKFIYRDKYTRDGWLNMMNERLKLAKKLLADDGVIFISIDDNEQAYLKVLCDEIFGEENFVSCVTILTARNVYGLKTSAVTDTIVKTSEYLLVYAKNIAMKAKFNPLYTAKKNLFDSHYSKSLINGEIVSWKTLIEQDKKIMHELTKLGLALNNENLNLLFTANYNFYKYFLDNYKDKLYQDSAYSQKLTDDESYHLQTGKILSKNGLMLFNTLNGDGTTRFLMPIEKSVHKTDDYEQKICDTAIRGNVWEYYDDMNNITKEGDIKFPNGKKPKRLIKDILKLMNNKSAFILDFFAGSGTTGQAVMELNEEDGGNRKFILVTNNENNIALNVTRERLYRVINGKGSKGEEIAWEYSKDKKSLINNSVRVFDLVKQELNITDIDKAGKIKIEAEDNFKKLNPKYVENGNLNIYNELASLTPYKDESED